MAEASASAPAFSMGEPAITMGEFFQLLGHILGALVFIILIGQDMRKEFKRGGLWIPGHALILSALTIQLMNFTENQTSLVTEVLQNNPNERNIVLNNLFMIHTSRVMLCVIVAFFLPTMARPGYEEKGGKIAALGLTVFLDIFSELASITKRMGKSGLYLSYYFYSWPHAQQAEQISFYVSGAIISMTFIWLILLLISAAIASKSMRNITTQKIPIIIGEPAEETWKGVEDHVLKSWIVARASYPESIIAKSVLASSAAMGLTICIISSVAGWISHGPIISALHGSESWLKLTTTILELIFILMGWVVVCWRSLSSVDYYARLRKEDGPKEKRWFSFFQIEDFWTRHIVDLQEVEKLKLRKLKVDERVSKMFVTKLRKLKVDERVSKMIAREKKARISFLSAFLQCVIWVQRSVVFFSKVYWLLSRITFGNCFMRRIVSIIFRHHFKKVDKDFEQYKEIMTNMDTVLWDQTGRDVFSTNRKSIKQAQLIIIKGNKDGENCHALIPFLKDLGLRFEVGMLCLDPRSAHDIPDFKFLWKRKPDPELDMEKYFKYARKRSWKLTAVLLINVIVQLSPLRGTNCLQAYYEAWELIDLVEESDPETDSLLSKAADRLFTNLREPGSDQHAATTTMVEPAKAINDLAGKSEEDAKTIDGKIVERKDTMEDWEKLAAWNALYKLCKSIDCSTSCGDFMELLLHELESALAYIIGACMTHVGATLVENSTRWAKDLDKNKLLEAVYIAGKSKGLMEQLKWSPNLERPMKQVKSRELQIVPAGGESGLSSSMHTETTTQIVVQ